MDFGEFLALHVDYANKLDLTVIKSDKLGYVTEELEHFATGTREELIEKLPKEVLMSKFWRIRTVLEGVITVDVEV